MNIWPKASSPLSQDYRENLQRGWVLVHQKKWGKPITFHSFISDPVDALRESSIGLSTGCSCYARTAKGCRYLLRMYENYNFFPHGPPEWMEQTRGLTSFQDILSQENDLLETTRSNRGIFLIFIKTITEANWPTLLQIRQWIAVSLPSW